MVIFIKVLDILSVSSSLHVVSLLSVLAFTTIVESVCRLRIVCVILTTERIVASEIQMEVKVLKTVNLIVSLKVTKENVSTSVKSVVFNEFHRVLWRVVVTSVRECRVVLANRLCPLPVSTPILVHLIVACDRASRVHSCSHTDSLLTTRHCLRVRILTVDVHGEMVLEERRVHSEARCETVVVRALEDTLLTCVANTETVRHRP